MNHLNKLNLNQTRRLALAFIILVALGVSAFIVRSALQSRAGISPSPYTDQLASPVRGLSAQEVDDLLNGRGAGYARTAELNSYPGPSHVLELQAELQLSDKQRQRIEQVYEQMNVKAERVGQLIVEREQQLSRAFAEGTVTEVTLEDQVAELAGLYGQLRTIHLQAHLAITPLLSPEQIASYNQLRGYDVAGETQEQHPHTDH